MNNCKLFKIKLIIKILTFVINKLILVDDILFIIHGTYNNIVIINLTKNLY